MPISSKACCECWGFEPKQLGCVAVLIMKEPTGQVTAAWLNSLSGEERAAFLGGGWATRMHQWATNHVSYIWWNRQTLLGTRATNNASVFFLELGSELFAVTAAHVFDAYCNDK